MILKPQFSNTFFWRTFKILVWHFWTITNDFYNISYLRRYYI